MEKLTERAEQTLFPFPVLNLIIATRYINFADKGGSKVKSPNLLWTSFMEFPYPVYWLES